MAAAKAEAEERARAHQAQMARLKAEHEQQTREHERVLAAADAAAAAVMMAFHVLRAIALNFFLSFVADMHLHDSSTNAVQRGQREAAQFCSAIPSAFMSASSVCCRVFCSSSAYAGWLATIRSKKDNSSHLVATCDLFERHV